MAGTAYLAARCTLHRRQHPTLFKEYMMQLPDNIGPQRSQKLICRDVRKELRLSDNTCIGKKDVQSTICFDSISHHSLYCVLVRSIEFSGMDVDAGI
jgi:hypothetical protein